MEPTDRPARSTRRRRRIAVLTMAGIATVGAVISYLDGLYLVHLAGAGGRAAYLYPLLPDGLIVISTEGLYDATQYGQPRPRWVTTGIVLGALLTVGMNVAAGARVKVPLALVDGVVPVVFFVALEILIGLIRRGRDGFTPNDPSSAVLATPVHPDPPRSTSPIEALAVLVASDSQRKLGELLGVPKARVQAWASMVRQVDGGAPSNPPAGTAPDASSSCPAGAPRGQGGKSAEVPRLRAEPRSRPGHPDTPAGEGAAVAPHIPGRGTGGQAGPGMAAGDPPAGDMAAAPPAPAGAGLNGNGAHG